MTPIRLKVSYEDESKDPTVLYLDPENIRDEDTAPLMAGRSYEISASDDYEEHKGNLDEWRADVKYLKECVQDGRAALSIGAQLENWLADLRSILADPLIKRAKVEALKERIDEVRRDMEDEPDLAAKLETLHKSLSDAYEEMERTKTTTITLELED